MKRSHRLLSFLLAVSATVMVSMAEAQTYIEVAPGSKYVCGLMPDGTNLIFVNGGSNDDPVDVKDAVKGVNRDIRKIEGRIERLKEIKKSLKDGVLSKSEIVGVTKMMEAVDPSSAKPIPPGKKERKKLINALIAKLRIDAQNRKNEVKKLQDCSKGKRPDGPAGTLGYEFLKLRADDDSIYITMRLFVPVVLNPDGDPYPQRWFCVKAAEDPRGQPLLFTDNPCFQGVPPFNGNLCPQFAKQGGYHTAFYKFRIFQGVHIELDHPWVIQAEGEFQDRYAGGVVGRPRVSLADNCQDVFKAPK